MGKPTKSTRDLKGPRGRRGERGTRGQRGVRGPKGERGEKGESGERGESTSLQAVARMAQELEAAQRELRIQFTRIAQLQADLDSLRSELKSRL
jgi:Collagen triple helix repeat (20 copies)